ncbi:MAG TPA: S8 family serine peptidase, partial [Gaiellaceae bacterium]|nr:S8 family serine peptidase [Gaiellaceae bacterium]
MTRRLLALLAVAALVVPAVAAAFPNTEPLAAKQWYLTEDKAWDHWDALPQLAPVKVAIVDSGVDGSHPDLMGRIVAARSFVGGSPYDDANGHGTFVAGEIAANPSNALGIAGLAFNARLIVAKVVTPDGEVSLPAEVAGIRWAVDQGAKVVNLSIGGVRDPFDATKDTYSPLEQAAVEYAYSKGAVVVAAAGNGPQSPATPWGYAAYPSALPHVLGVSAVTRTGAVPAYSNRDAIYVDIAAPGDDIFSTVPTSLVTPGCADG